MNSETILNKQLSNEDKLIHFNNSIMNLNLFKKDIDIFIENLINNYYNFKNTKLVLDQVLLLKKLFITYGSNLNIIFNRLLNSKNKSYEEENNDFKKLYDNNFKITVLIGNIPINVKEKISSKIYNILSILNEDINIINTKELDTSDINIDVNIGKEYNLIEEKSMEEELMEEELMEEELIEEEDMPISDGLFSLKSFVIIFVVVSSIFLILGISLGLSNFLVK